jgi:hypothetical protein
MPLTRQLQQQPSGAALKQDLGTQRISGHGILKNHAHGIRPVSCREWKLHQILQRKGRFIAQLRWGGHQVQLLLQQQMAF